MSGPTRSVVAQNRVFWEALAPHRPGAPAEFFAAGGSALDEHELARIGELRGRRVLHLACSTGDESITMAGLGARVVGLDLAAAHLVTARNKAAAVGAPVRFVEGDMTDLDPDLTGFDLVFISWGGLCWVPELTGWMTMISARLNPGGRLMISEHHPLWEVLSVRGDGMLTVTGDYFGTDAGAVDDPAKAPVVTRELSEPPPPRHSFVHPVGAVVGAALGAGLRIASFEEFADPAMFVGLGPAAALLPATYLLTAERVGGPVDARAGASVGGPG